MLDLSKLKKAQTALVRATVQFRSLVGLPFAMPGATPEQPPNGGVSWDYQGGKFSSPLPYSVAQKLALAIDRGEKLEFSLVELEVEPAAFGREKRAGLKIVDTVRLEVDGVAIYQREEDPVGAAVKGKKNG